MYKKNLSPWYEEPVALTRIFLLVLLNCSDLYSGQLCSSIAGGPKCLNKDCTDVIVFITISPKMITASYLGQLMLFLFSCSVRFRAGERLRPPTIRNGREAVPGQLHQQIKPISPLTKTLDTLSNHVTYTISKRGYHHIFAAVLLIFSQEKRRSKDRS